MPYRFTNRATLTIDGRPVSIDVEVKLPGLPQSPRPASDDIIRKTSPDTLSAAAIKTLSR